MFEPPQYSFEKATSSCGVLERFKSATFLTLEDDVHSTILPSISLISSWVTDFHQWFVQSIGLPSGAGAHLLYDREIALTGNSLLQHTSELLELGTVIRPLGFAFAITISTRELGCMHQEIEHLLDSGLITSVAILVSEECGVSEVASLEKIALAGVNLGLIGDVRTWRVRSLFTSAVLSASDLTWYPSLTARDQIPNNPVRHCYSRFRLYVDAFGEIYPCLGLVGIEGASLGNISDAISSTGLADPTVRVLLDNWQTRGPSIDALQIVPDNSDSGLPPMCRLHRSSLRG